MLGGRPTKYCGGIQIYGDSADLRELYKVTTDLMSEVNELHQEFLLSLNYEVRKAYDGHRDTEVFGIDGELKYHVFELAWPHFLFVVSQIRHLARWRPTSARHHAVLYRLEYLIEEALKETDVKIGEEAWQLFKRMDEMPENFLTSFIESVNFDYLCRGSVGKLRFKRLPQMLRHLDWRSEAYREYQTRVNDLSKATSMQPAQIDFDYPWIDVKM